MKMQIKGEVRETMILRRFTLVMAVIFAASSMAGCSDLKDKFVRKKKGKVSARRYYAVKTYHIKPSLDLYTKRFVIWKAWQNELEAVLLNDNSKKPRMASDQALSNLVDMQNMLVEEKFVALGKYVDEMTKVEKTIRTQKVTPGNQTWLKKQIELIGFEVERRFSYNDMKKYIADEFHGSAAESAAAGETEAVEEAKEDVGPEPSSSPGLVAQPATVPSAPQADEDTPPAQAVQQTTEATTGNQSS